MLLNLVIDSGFPKHCLLFFHPGTFVKSSYANRLLTQVKVVIIRYKLVSHFIFLYHRLRYIERNLFRQDRVIRLQCERLEPHFLSFKWTLFNCPILNLVELKVFVLFSNYVYRFCYDLPLRSCYKLSSSCSWRRHRIVIIALLSTRASQVVRFLWRHRRSLPCWRLVRCHLDR